MSLLKIVLCSSFISSNKSSVVCTDTINDRNILLKSTIHISDEITFYKKGGLSVPRGGTLTLTRCHRHRRHFLRRQGEGRAGRGAVPAAAIS